MIVIDSLEDFPRHDYVVVTSGMFDGVHVGHQKILKDVSRQAKAKSGVSVVITYWPHPRFVLKGEDTSLKLLTTFEEKSRLIETCEIDYLLKIPFNRSFSQLTADEYVDQILIKMLGTSKLVIGYDHKFGKNQEGSFEYLQTHKDRFGFEVQEIPRQDIEHVGVSSTKIRNALMSGHVSTANEYLDRNYCIHGIVTKGEQIGRKIGFPTANLFVTENYKLIPMDGVYAVIVRLGDLQFKGMLNIGNRPTVDGQNRTIEVNIFNFEEEIYGRSLTIDFISFLRSEIKFQDLASLRTQLEKDKESAINALKHIQYEAN